MAAFRILVRSFSLLFHIILCLLVLGISCIALLSGPQPLRLGMLPWSGLTLDYVLLFGSLFGLVSAILAVFGRLRVLFLLWALAVAVVLARGYFLSPYRFTHGSVRNALYLTVASWLAILGAWFQLRAPFARKAAYRGNY
jgi:hypothetical protein